VRLIGIETVACMALRLNAGYGHAVSGTISAADEHTLRSSFSNPWDV